jgi:hypothetical protein
LTIYHLATLVFTGQTQNPIQTKGENDMITIFSDFPKFSAKMAFFLKTNVIMQNFATTSSRYFE